MLRAAANFVVRKQILVIVLLATTLTYPSIPQADAWSSNGVNVSIFRGPNDERIRDMAVDNAGNIFTTGDFVGQADLDLDSSNMDSYAPSPNDMNIFISKLDASGNSVWFQTLGGIQPDSGRAIALDSSGNVYVAGMFSDVLIVGTNPIINSQGSTDVFLVKLDSSGSFEWVKTIGGTDRDEVGDITLNPAGDIFLTGNFRGNADFDPGAGVEQFSGVTNDDIFVLKLNSIGNFVAVTKFGSSSNDQGRGISLDSAGRIYVLGNYASNTANPRAILTSFNTDVASARWTKLIGGDLLNQGNSIAIDTNNNILMTGMFQNTLYFGETETTLVSPSDSRSAYVIKADSNGELIWAKDLRSDGAIAGNAWGTYVSTDTASNVFVSGYFSGQIDFIPGNDFLFARANGGNDGFLVKLNGSGQYVWSKKVGGTAADEISANKAMSDGSVRIAGSFKETADLDVGEYRSSNFTSIGGFDAFISKLAAETTHNCSAGGSFMVSNGDVIQGSTCLGIATIPDGVTAIGADAFKNVFGLTGVTLPSTLEVIGDGAFYGTSLTNIAIPNNVTLIDRFAFASSTLTSVSIPASINTIGDSAFYNNTTLLSVTFAANSLLTSIGEEAFRECTALESFTIPGNVSSIGAAAFYGSNNLASFNFLGNAPTNVGSLAFSGVANNAKAYALLGKIGFTKPTWNGLIVSQPEPAVIVIPTYAIIYDANTTDSSNRPFDYSRYISKEVVRVSKQLPVRIGHTFLNWNTKADGTGVSYVPGSLLTLESSDISLYAQWSVNTYKFAIDINGGPDIKFGAEEVRYGALVTVPSLKEDQKRVGHDFLGWNSKIDGSGTHYSATSNFRFPAMDLTLYAQWKARTYKNVYYGNGVKIGRVPRAFTQEFDLSSKVSAPSKYFSRRGYMFAGWSESKLGDGKVYVPGETLTQPARDMELYAIWKPNTYQVRFLNTSIGLIPNSQFITGGQILSAPIPSLRQGFVFKGWSSSPSKTTVVAFPYTPNVTRNISLYAVWVKKKMS